MWILKIFIGIMYGVIRLRSSQARCVEFQRDSLIMSIIMNNNRIDRFNNNNNKYNLYHAKAQVRHGIYPKAKLSLSLNHLKTHIQEFKNISISNNEEQ
ncbi:hypothetical protein PPL_03295 [Heterostelium album PN500]|uniref:Uncharacterized protein n=1 Tax=Heterostelium pallidum (strain ATCC 26659 / Pp 5 / PN500) TaxID=670386 RepID=D3B4H0_HETP5|nr:hypothetical protein PPL_03295 [Heterostelium album PN500]EFA84218.1 hypothetical protein PPL_03295 [Heterostelium album PN500]|eukprot:XP_020436334.1 hypothetical protein PPL_03295 [Heterostelium album PN500]